MKEKLLKVIDKLSKRMNYRIATSEDKKQAIVTDGLVAITFNTQDFPGIVNDRTGNKAYYLLRATNRYFDDCKESIDVDFKHNWKDITSPTVLHHSGLLNITHGVCETVENIQILAPLLKDNDCVTCMFNHNGVTSKDLVIPYCIQLDNIKILIAGNAIEHASYNLSTGIIDNVGRYDVPLEIEPEEHDGFIYINELRCCYDTSAKMVAEMLNKKAIQLSVQESSELRYALTLNSASYKKLIEKCNQNNITIIEHEFGR